MSSISKSLADAMRKEIDNMFYQSLATTNAAPDTADSSTTEDILETMRTLMKDIPQPAPTVQFVSDAVFPQEHYADKVELIPHHPAYRAVAKFFDPNAETATVMFNGQETRPNGTCFQVGNTVYVPNSLRHKFEK